MQSFKDKSGVQRFIALTIGKAKRIKAAIGLDLIDEGAPIAFARIYAEPLLRSSLIYWSLEDRESLTEDQFDALMDGDAIKEADKAIWEEIHFFIQSLRPELATVLEQVKAKHLAVSEIQVQMIVELANSAEMSSALQREMSQALTKAKEELGSLSTTRQEPLESTPAA